MQYISQNLNPKEYQGDLVLLYGDEVADRSLPLSRKEIDLIHHRRSIKKSFVQPFDRLPYRIYVVSFDSELPSARSQEMLRRAAKDLHTLFRNDEVRHLAVTGEGTLTEEIVALVEGLSLADYSFDRYRSTDIFHLDSLVVDDRYLSQAELDTQARLWNRIFWCREWVNLPVADLNAPRFADELQAVAADLPDVTCTVMDKKQIQSLRMGGLIAVNSGSVDEPRFVVLEYHPAGSPDQPIALVGKGVMFDTGGLNIKPDDYMQEMKSDMAGAATMASVLFAAADNRLPVHIVALLPLTDNRPAFNAYAPDDILTMYDGTTVEIVNTDAEGRLILADAIAYAAKVYNPRLIIDAATLTGAAVRAISTFGIAAMHKNAADDLRLLHLVGEQVYERLADFPMWDEYDELIKSPVADLRNCATVPQAGTITAAKFLAHFAHEVSFIHLDIAGVAFFSKPQHYYAQGASAVGVRLLYAFLQMQS